MRGAQLKIIINARNAKRVISWMSIFTASFSSVMNIKMENVKNVKTSLH